MSSALCIRLYRSMLVMLCCRKTVSRRIPSSEMLRLVVFVRTDVSEELSAFIISSQRASVASCD
jgi:hypothetical protein